MTAPTRTAPHPLLTALGMVAVFLFIAGAFWCVGYCLDYINHLAPGVAP